MGRDLWAASIEATKRVHLYAAMWTWRQPWRMEDQGSAGVGVKMSDDQGQGRR